MPVIYVKDPHLKSRESLTIGDSKATSVSSFKTDVAGKIGLRADEIMLMYGGRILKQGRTLSDYSIIDGVTVFYMKRKEPREFSSERAAQERALEQLRTMIRNPRIFKILSRLVANPPLLENLLKGSVIYNNPAIQKLLHDSEIKSSAGDPESLIRAFEARPEEAVVITDVLGVLGAAVEDVTEITGYESEEIEGELVEMMDNCVEDGTEFLGGNQESVQGQELADAQDQMFHHSQALLAHQQNQSTASVTTQQPESMEMSLEATHPQPQPQSPPSYEALMNLSRQVSTGSGQSGSSGITQDMLANALSTLQYPHPASPPPSGPTSLSSSHLQPPQPSHSGPSSLPSQLTTGEEQSSSSISPSSSLPGRSSSTPFAGITEEDLMQALQTVTQHVSTDQSQSSSSSTHRSRHRHHQPQSRAGRQHHYQKQLQQLKSMGLSDEAAVLHALEATKGDINAALELLIGGGQF